MTFGSLTLTTRTGSMIHAYFPNCSVTLRSSCKLRQDDEGREGYAFSLCDVAKDATIDE